MYKIGVTNNELEKEFQKISKNPKISKDYSDFLSEYGLGNINELIYFNQPDQNFIILNFKEYLDLWIWSEKEQHAALNSIVIGGTSDGDIIAIIDEQKPYLILPRNSEIPLYFFTLKQVISYYIACYDIKEEYFDFSYNNEIENFEINTNSFEFIHKNIIDNIEFDKEFNNGFNQIKYVIQKIGGWLYFDNLHKNSLRIKYQKKFQDEANGIIAVIQEIIHKNT